MNIPQFKHKQRKEKKNGIKKNEFLFLKPQIQRFFLHCTQYYFQRNEQVYRMIYVTLSKCDNVIYFVVT